MLDREQQLDKSETISLNYSYNKSWNACEQVLECMQTSLGTHANKSCQTNIQEQTSLGTCTVMRNTWRIMTHEYRTPTHPWKFRSVPGSALSLDSLEPMCLLFVDQRKWCFFTCMSTYYCAWVLSTVNTSLIRDGSTPVYLKKTLLKKI